MMRWYTNNTKLEPAPNNNFKYGKIEPKSRKTDGFMAFVNAFILEGVLPETYEISFLEPILL
jgi:phage terminase large subunit-like protein